MADKTCNCSGCDCTAEHTEGVEVKGQWYCCVACSVDHLDGEPCAMAGCECGSTGVKTREEGKGHDKVDHAVDETFPASDPISP
ncbi:metallothionein [Pseudomonas japonica]|uniref:metallothionein n=1 Tax=Pseudomonas japonica TaxID=256466 RepID=UPI0015E3CF8A|nr:metallothionein [Pseudomonas japonica]MBA1245154.1 metallothionein [Pseudomonas japonica]MBA1289496.1 metallothionein [Pseudomonas japonica]